MSNLKLVADEPTQLERLLLEASRQEQPSDEHKARLRAALGLGAPLADPVPAPPAPPAASASVSSGAAKSASLGKIALGVGVLGALAALWLARPTTEASSAPAPVAPAPEVQVRVAPTPVPAEPVPVAAEPAPALEISPPPLPQSTVAAPARVRVAPSAASADDLSEQIRLIEAARAGVAARDAKSALSALNDYSSKFPRGSFGQEASVLRIRAIDQSGDSARATAMAKAFIARFPSSPHVARLKPIAERGASR